MRDKQETIINGVNVSGCDNPGWILLLPGTGVSYKCDTNCRYACYVYKEQLQRKTAELKKYQDMEKEGPEQYKDVGECWGCGLELTNQQLLKDFKAKTAECEELKESASIAEDNFACEIQARLYHQNEWLKFSEENARYRNALEEIERICLRDRDISDVCLISTRLETPRCKYDIQDEILDIISKAKGEE